MLGHCLSTELDQQLLKLEAVVAAAVELPGLVELDLDLVPLLVVELVERLEADRMGMVDVVDTVDQAEYTADLDSVAFVLADILVLGMASNPLVVVDH
jgi:hypothetical protein